VGHRVVTAARGRAAELHYLVRWEGAVPDSWEPADLLDACEGALAEYWTTVVVSGQSIPHGDTSVVRGRVRQIRARAVVGAPLATIVDGQYHLPPSLLVQKLAPTAVEL